MNKVNTKVLIFKSDQIRLRLNLDSVFIKSREPDTWENAREYCTSFGGNLATLNNIEIFRDDVRKQEIILTPGEELWVGASLKYGPWTWSGNSEQELKGTYIITYIS